MADVQNIITLGIGSAPGNIRYFVLVGLDVNPVPVVPAAVNLLALPRSRSLAAPSRQRTLEAMPRSRSLVTVDRDD